MNNRKGGVRQALAKHASRAAERLQSMMGGRAAWSERPGHYAVFLQRVRQIIPRKQAENLAQDVVSSCDQPLLT